MAPDPPARDNSLDVARGVAMVLVVAGHSVRGLAAARIGPPALRAVDTFLYLIHLPVFAVAVGLLTPASVGRAGSRRYLARRLALLVYLYLVWTLIQGAAEVWSSPAKNRPVSWADVARLWVPIGQLWFLPHLAVATLILIAVAPWRPGARVSLGAVGVLAVSLAGWGWDPALAGLGGLGLLVWYLLGARIGARRYAAAVARLPTAALLAAGICLVLAVAWLSATQDVTTPTTQSARTVASVALGVAGVSLGVAGTFALCEAWSRSGSSRAVAYVGRHSLPVYLAHIVVTAGTRIVLVRLGVTDAVVHILAATALGVTLPLVLERVTRPVPYLFVPPWQVGPRSLAPTPR